MNANHGYTVSHEYASWYRQFNRTFRWLVARVALLCVAFLAVVLWLAAAL